MKKYKLQKTVLISYALYAMVLILCIGTVVVVQHIRTKTNENHTIAFAFTKAAAEYIDGDAVQRYAATGENDAYYAEVERYLSASLNNSNILDFYIGVPGENGILFLWDVAKTGEEFAFGESIPYSDYGEGAKEYLESVFCQNPREDVITGYENGVYIATACSPVFNSAGEPVAVVAVDLSMPNVEAEISSALLAVILVIVLFVLVSAFLFFIFTRKRIILPIQKLNDASKNIVDNLENNRDLSINIKTGNEIEDLGHSFMQMYDEVGEYIERLSVVTAEKERIGTELDVAARIQASMLPCIFPPFPDKKEFDIFAIMNPAKEVGGDFYDFFMIDNQNLAVVVADVSGKGVPAALFMVIGKTLIKDHTGFQEDLGEVFTEVNNILCASNSEEMFITAFEGVININTGEFRYVNAGHETPFICKKNGVYEPFRIKAGFVLAGMEDFPYKGGCMMLEPGDKLFQYTDGVTEATNAENKLYGMDRLEKVLADNSRRSPRELLEIVNSDIAAFVGDAPQFDDITMLCVEYKGTGNMTERSFGATVDNIEKVTEYINELLEARLFPLSAQTQIDIAVDELFSNIARYAYPSATGEVTVQVKTSSNPTSADITFIDDGIPFNPLLRADPDVTLSAEDRDIGGLGIYMVKKSMDDVFYERRDGKNILTIRKLCERGLACE